MNQVISRRDTCRLCGANDHELVLGLAPTPIVDAYVPSDRLEQVQEAYPLDIYLCRACGHSQLMVIMDPEVLYRNYIYDTATSPGLVKHFQKYAGDVLKRINAPDGSLVIDLGSNDGSLLKAFQGSGMRVLGVDPAREIARKATEQGVETIPNFFTLELAREILRDKGPAAAVTVNNLFANVDDVTDMVEGIRTLLAPDGVFVFETFYLADLIQNKVFDFIYHEHLNYYSVKPLDAFFSQHGMELFDIERVNTKGGSLRGFVQPAGGPRPISPCVAELSAAESRNGLYSSQHFEEFSYTIDRAKSQVVSLVHSLKEAGKSLAGYGAGASTTMLIYQLGIGEELDFIVDDYPDRQGLYSPGQHIPVVSAEAMYDNNLDYVIVLAWRYAKTIIEKHQKFLDKGGRFIVPLPEFEVI